MSLQLYVGAKKLKVKMEDGSYTIKNDLLFDAMKYAGQIEKGNKTLNDVPAELKILVAALITK